MRKMIFLISSAAIFILIGHTECNAFRCGSGFAGVGDIKQKVVLECGQPTSKEKVGTKKEPGESTDDTATGKRHKKSKRKKKAGTVRPEYEETSNRRIEKWYYNCGKDDFIYVLTFEGDVLTKEETGGYGKGKSDCAGSDR
jgi:hypothetical protein